MDLDPKTVSSITHWITNVENYIFDSSTPITYSTYDQTKYSKNSTFYEEGKAWIGLCPGAHPFKHIAAGTLVPLEAISTGNDIGKLATNITKYLLYTQHSPDEMSLYLGIFTIEDAVSDLKANIKRILLKQFCEGAASAKAVMDDYLSSLAVGESGEAQESLNLEYLVKFLAFTSTQLGWACAYKFSNKGYQPVRGLKNDLRLKYLKSLLPTIKDETKVPSIIMKYFGWYIKGTICKIVHNICELLEGSKALTGFNYHTLPRHFIDIADYVGACNNAGFKFVNTALGVISEDAHVWTALAGNLTPERLEFYKKYPIAYNKLDKTKYPRIDINDF